MGNVTSEETVLVRRDGRVGRIVLNRPRAINALNHEMVDRVDRALGAWERDDAVSAVVITGAGERGLCAGGDIRAIYEDVRLGEGGQVSREFWRAEYLLNGRIARYAKPYVAIMDGITMGGGVGISAHGSVRIVTERSVIAMPETGIGFVPDVGGTYLLNRAPGELGTHLALTGNSIGAGDALLCGLADYFIPSDKVAAFTASLEEVGVADAVRMYAEAAPEGELAEQREWIDECYGADTVEEILERLVGRGDTAAKAAAVRIAAVSPTAVKTTFRAMRRARELGSLEKALEQEYRVSCASLLSPDFAEGVRAQVIDKDRTPHWSPATLAEVKEEDVERFFAPLGDRELAW